MKNPVAEFYRAHPRMISSPFGGIDGVDRELYRRVFEAMGVDVKQKKILDIGCGRGFLGDLVRDADGDYTGVDFVPSRAGFRFALADAAHLPFPDATFDGACCVDAFEHFPAPDVAAREMRRILRPGGFLFLSSPNYSNVAGVVKRVYESLGIYEPNTWAPFGRWQPQEYESPLTGGRVRRIFRGAGFGRIARIGHGTEVGLGVFPWIDHPRMPDAIRFRLQRLFATIGPGVAGMCPGASLHNFWKMDV